MPIVIISFLGGSDQSTLEYISRALGKQTINVLSHGRTRGRSSGSSINYSTKSRDLMTPDEIAILPDDKCILMVRGMRPFYSTNSSYKNIQNIRIWV